MRELPCIGVVGLGYVGLPLAAAFGRHFRTVGIDLSPEKVEVCRLYRDPTGEVSEAELRAAEHLQATTDFAALQVADVIVVAVPTPVDHARLPDFGPLIAASRAVAPYMKDGAIVVYESTVYPGATEERCIPELEQASGKKWQRDFFVGYSPERINPGDRTHRLPDVIKVVAGDTARTLDVLAEVYATVVTAGVHRAPSIRVAEAAKVIENTQRDLNIALMNELAIIFHRMGLDTGDVLAAAGTKWNFLKFSPGLVGGHCIGVDPYYLTYQAERHGHHPQVILAGRRINDGMGAYVATQTVKAMAATCNGPATGRVNVLGTTFKENCPDIRNSKVMDVVKGLREYGLGVSIHDPLASPCEMTAHYGETLTDWTSLPRVQAVVLAVAHRQYADMLLPELLACLEPGGVVVDVKSMLDRQAVAALGYRHWRL